MKPRLLIVDDEKATREGLRRALSGDYGVTLAASADAAMALLDEGFDLVLTDLRMPGLDGIGFLRELTAREHPPTAIMLTAYGSIETAVEAVKAGAYDFLTKPVNLDKLELMLARAMETRSLRNENRQLKKQLASARAPHGMIGRSAAMKEIMDTLEQIAPARSTVLLTGESGTGKELAAKALHDMSERRSKPFITVHCAALASSLLQSELFGHEKGAFTNATSRRTGRFEAADGGTLFLDEIGEIDPAVQVTLLRFLENRAFERVGGNQVVEVDVRLVAATNRDLWAEVQQGNFREDLYFRLDVLHLRMPPLRERREDIPLLINHYLQIFNAENGRQVETVMPDALDRLIAYDWPGNVRELRNCVERLVVMSRGNTVSLSDVPEAIRGGVPVAPPATAVEPPATLNIESNEKHLIEEALRACNGNRSAAARKLGISRRTLHRKLNLFDLR